MGIKKLFFESSVILTFITLFVVILNSYQIHQSVSKDLKYLQKQYLDATFEIYKNEIIGDVLVGNKQILKALLNEISSDRGVGVVLTYDSVTLQTAAFKPRFPIVLYNLNLGNEKFAKIWLFPMRSLKVFNFFTSLVVPLTLEVFVLIFCFLILLQRIKWNLLNPLKELAIKLQADEMVNFSIQPGAVIELTQLANALQNMTIDLRKKAQYEAESKAAKQVAHDIRSPLACLNLLLSYTISLPEKQRILMRSSIQRITDIANMLQSKAKEIEDPSILEGKAEVTMISSLLELLVTEKRMQLGLAANIRIDLNIDKSYGLFSNINTVEFRRVVSNLIDNSIESFDGRPHHISITVDCSERELIIQIEDDGRGIPREILSRVGTYGFTYGKEGLKSAGSGIGVFHALKTVTEFGGSFQISSEFGYGTRIMITLPRAIPPMWFVPTVNLDKIKLIVVMDDDDSIHTLWLDKLQRNKHKDKIKIMNFKSQVDFEVFVRNATNELKREALFFVDYEFLNQDLTGLDIIERLNIQHSSILVTSYYEDLKVKEKSTQLGVKIIPKSIVSYIPVS